MPSTFTTNTGIEKIGDGEQSGLWGQTTNVNFDIVDRALNGVIPITLLSTAFTLTTSSGGLSDGQAAAVVFDGSLGSPATVTVAPSNAQKTYVIRNDSNQPLTITQGSGGDVTIPVGGATVVVCTGEGAAARVFEAGISEVNLATGVTGTLAIANGGTGTTSTQFANLTTNVTGTLPVANGGTGGLLPVANGGTGRNTITSGALVLGAGTSQVGQLTGSAVGQVPQWDGSAWGVGSLPSSGVTSVTASSPLSSSGGATPNITLSGTISSAFLPQLTQVQAQNTGSTVFALVSGQRMAQSISNYLGLAGVALLSDIRSWMGATSAGAVGSHVLARIDDSVTVLSFGALISGGLLTTTSVAGQLGGQNLTGSWRCMSIVANNSIQHKVGVFLRVS